LAVDGTGINGDSGLAINARVFPGAFAFDKLGNLFIADGNSRIRKISTSGIITTVAGNGVAGYGGDSGIATNAMLNYPQDLAIDTLGNLYISDLFNNRIRVVSTDGIIRTYAGTGLPGYSGDNGPATSAEINDPAGIVVDKLGNLYFGDGGCHGIRKVSPSGVITTVAGVGVIGFSGDGGLATAAALHDVKGLAFDDTGNLYATDIDNYRIRKIDPSGIITTIAGNGLWGALVIMDLRRTPPSIHGA
jgi:sugar lactone lactonase YvrE